MTKPNDYRAIYILATDTSYQNTGTTTKGTHSGEGTLHKGRVVWLREDTVTVEQDSPVSVYAEGVGLVLLNAASIEPVPESSAART
ncbi:MAG: hypothetical protein NVSMB3_10350 [Acidobacteriaceae bacterium]